MPTSFVVVILLFLLLSLILIRPVQPLTYKLNATLIYE